MTKSKDERQQELLKRYGEEDLLAWQRMKDKQWVLTAEYLTYAAKLWQKHKAELAAIAAEEEGQP